MKWHWGEEQQQALDSLKKALMSAPILAFPSVNDIVANPFHLQTDTSNTGLGVVLTQVQDREERVISFASSTLLSAESNYSVTERECLVVVWGIRKFRECLEGFFFKVITDHSSLKWLHNLRNRTGRPAKWSLELLGYDFEIIHRKRALRHVPDALSRITEDEEIPISSACDTSDSWYKRRIATVLERPGIFPD